MLQVSNSTFFFSIEKIAIVLSNHEPNGRIMTRKYGVANAITKRIPITYMNVFKYDDTILGRTSSTVFWSCDFIFQINTTFITNHFLCENYKNMCRGNAKYMNLSQYSPLSAVHIMLASLTFPKRLIMRPSGVVSKKDIGARKMVFSIPSWSEADDMILALAI